MHHIFVKNDNPRWHDSVHVNDETGLIDSVGYPRTNGAVPPPDVFEHGKPYDQTKADAWAKAGGWTEDPVEAQRMDELFKQNPDMYMSLAEKYPDTFGPQAKTAVQPTVSPLGRESSVWYPFLYRDGQVWVGRGGASDREEHYDLFKEYAEEILTSYEQDQYAGNTTDFMMDMLAKQDPHYMRGVLSGNEVRFFDPSYEMSADPQDVVTCVMELFQHNILRTKNPVIMFADTQAKAKPFKQFVGLDSISSLKFASLSMLPFLYRRGKMWFGAAYEDQDGGGRQPHYEILDDNIDEILTPDERKATSVWDVLAQDPHYLRGIYDEYQVQFLDPSHEADADLQDVATCVMELFKHGLKSKNPTIGFWDDRTLAKPFKQLMGLEKARTADLAYQVANEQITSFTISGCLKEVAEDTYNNGQDPKTERTIDVTHHSRTEFDTIEELAEMYGLPADEKLWIAFYGRIMCQIMEDQQGDRVTPGMQEWDAFVNQGAKLWAATYDFHVTEVTLSSGAVIDMTNLDDQEAEQLLGNGLMIQTYSKRDPELSLVVESALKQSDLTSDVLALPKGVPHVKWVRDEMDEEGDSVQGTYAGHRDFPRKDDQLVYHVVSYLESEEARKLRGYAPFSDASIEGSILYGEAQPSMTGDGSESIDAWLINFTEDEVRQIVENMVGKAQITADLKFADLTNDMMAQDAQKAKLELQRQRKINKLRQFTLDSRFKNESLSHATMRTEDLLKSYAWFLQEFAPAIWQHIKTDDAELIEKWDHAEASSEDPWWDSEEPTWLLETFNEWLNSIAPEGTYFGASEGDGSDYGFWETGEEDEDPETGERLGSLQFADLTWNAVHPAEIVVDEGFGRIRHYNFQDWTYWIESSTSQISESRPSQMRRDSNKRWGYRHIQADGTWGPWSWMDNVDGSIDHYEAAYQTWLAGESRLTTADLTEDTLATPLEHRIKITYNRTTPASVEQGDFSESGWKDEEGELIEPDEGDFEYANSDMAYTEGIARAAAYWLFGHGAQETSSSPFQVGSWYSTGWYDDDDFHGGQEQESFHLYGFTPEEEQLTYNEFKKLGGVRASLTFAGTNEDMYHQYPNDALSPEKRPWTTKTEHPFISPEQRKALIMQTFIDQGDCHAIAETFRRLYGAILYVVHPTDDRDIDYGSVHAFVGYQGKFYDGFGQLNPNALLKQYDKMNPNVGYMISRFDNFQHEIYPFKVRLEKDVAHIEKLLDTAKKTSSLKFAAIDAAQDITEFVAKARRGQIWRIADYKLYSRDAYVIADKVTFTGSGAEHEGWKVTGLVWLEQHKKFNPKEVFDEHIRFQVSYMYQRQFPMTLIGNWETGVMQPQEQAPAVAPAPKKFPTGVKMDLKNPDLVGKPAEMSVPGGPVVGKTVTAIAPEEVLAGLAGKGEEPAHTGEQGIIDSVLPSLEGPWRRHPEYTGVVMIKSGEKTWYVPYSHWQDFIALQTKQADLVDQSLETTEPKFKVNDWVEVTYVDAGGDVVNFRGQVTRRKWQAQQLGMLQGYWLYEVQDQDGDTYHGLDEDYLKSYDPIGARAALTLEATEYSTGKYWLSPAGDLVDAYFNHPRAAQQILQQRTGVKPDINTVMDQLLHAGWVRIIITSASPANEVVMVLDSQQMENSQSSIIEFLSSRPNGPLYIDDERGQVYGGTIQKYLDRGFIQGRGALTFKSAVPEQEIFVAIPVPEEVRKKYKHIEGLDDDLHITLVYVPGAETTEKQQQAILDAVSGVCHDFVPFTCQFTGLGSFDNGDGTFAALVNIPMGAELQTLIQQAIEQEYGEWKSKYGYLPHMTLKYKGDGETDLDDLRDFKWTCKELRVCFSDPSDKHWLIPIGKKGTKEVPTEKKESKLGRWFKKLAQVFGAVAVPWREQLDYPNFAEVHADLADQIFYSKDLDNVLAQTSSGFQSAFSFFFDKSRIRTNITETTPEYSVRAKHDVIGRNVRVFYNNDVPEIRGKYHNTDIVIFRPDHVELYTKGFHTKTTGERINSLLNRAGVPGRVSFTFHRGNYVYLEGMANPQYTDRQGVLVGSLYYWPSGWQGSAYYVEDGLQISYDGQVLNAEPAKKVVDVNSSLKFSDLADDVLGFDDVGILIGDETFHIDFYKKQYWIASPRSQQTADSPSELRRGINTGGDVMWEWHHPGEKFWHPFGELANYMIEAAYVRLNSSSKLADLTFDALHDEDYYKSQIETIKTQAQVAVEAQKQATLPMALQDIADIDFQNKPDPKQDTGDDEQLQQYIKYVLSLKAEEDEERHIAEEMEELVKEYARIHGWEILDDDGDWEHYNFSLAKHFETGVETYKIEMRADHIDVPRWIQQMVAGLPGLEELDLSEVARYLYYYNEYKFNNDEIFQDDNINRELRENDRWTEDLDPLTYVSYYMMDHGSDQGTGQDAHSVYDNILSGMMSDDKRQGPFDPTTFEKPEHWPGQDQSPEALHEREMMPAKNQYEMFTREQRPVNPRKPQTVKDIWPRGYPHQYSDLHFSDLADEALRTHEVVIDINNYAYHLNFETNKYWIETGSTSTSKANPANMRRLQDGRWQYNHVGQYAWFNFSDDASRLIDRAYVKWGAETGKYGNLKFAMPITDDAFAHPELPHEEPLITGLSTNMEVQFFDTPQLLGAIGLEPTDVVGKTFRVASVDANDQFGSGPYANDGSIYLHDVSMSPEDQENLAIVIPLQHWHRYLHIVRLQQQGSLTFAALTDDILGEDVPEQKPGVEQVPREFDPTFEDTPAIEPVPAPVVPHSYPLHQAYVHMQPGETWELTCAGYPTRTWLIRSVQQTETPHDHPPDGAYRLVVHTRDRDALVITPQNHAELWTATRITPDTQVEAGLAFDVQSSYLTEAFTGWIEPNGVKHEAWDHYRFAMDWINEHPEQFPDFNYKEVQRDYFAYKAYQALFDKGWIRVASDAVSIGPLAAGGKSALIEFLSAQDPDRWMQVEENSPIGYWSLEGTPGQILSELEKLSTLNIRFEKIGDYDRPMGLSFWGFISPSGDFLSLADYGTKYHEPAAEQIISGNPQYRSMFNGDRELAVEFLLRLGWTRVNQGTTFEVGRWDGNVKSNVITYIAKLPKNYHVIIEQYHPEFRSSSTLFYGDATDVLESLSSNKEGWKKMADWQQYLQSHRVDVPEFWSYARKNQIWSFIREGYAQHQGEYVRRFVKVLELHPETDLVSGTYGYSVEEAMMSDVVSEGQPLKDQWANIMFVQSAQEPVINGTE